MASELRRGDRRSTYRGPDRRGGTGGEAADATWIRAGVIAILVIGVVAGTHDVMKHEGVAGRLTDDLWMITLVLAALLGLGAHRLWYVSGSVRCCRMASAGWLLAGAATLEAMPEEFTTYGLSHVLMLAAAVAVLRTVHDPDVDTSARQPREFLRFLAASVGGWAVLWPVVLSPWPALGVTVFAALSAAAWTVTAAAVFARRHRKDRVELAWVPVLALMLAVSEVVHMVGDGDASRAGLFAAALAAGSLVLAVVGSIAGLAGNAVGRRGHLQTVIERARSRDGERLSRQQEHAHEVHNALLAIEGAVATLDANRSAMTGPAQRRLTDLLVRELHAVRDLIDDTSTADLPALLAPGSFDLGAVVREQVELARARGLRVRLAEDGTGPISVMGEAGSAGRVIANLLLNAERHGMGGDTDASAVRVTVERGASAHEVAVRDRGPGVSREVAAEIFDRGRRSSERQGSGLGLYIARREMRAMGGELSLEPSTQGACFVARFACDLIESVEAVGAARS